MLFTFYYRNFTIIIMGTSKKSLFTPEQNRIAELAKALGHPARIAILQHLFSVNTCICNDIVEELPLAQSTISQHLKALKNVGLIKGSIGGKSICYCIDENTWKEAKLIFNALKP